MKVITETRRHAR